MRALEAKVMTSEDVYGPPVAEGKTKIMYPAHIAEREGRAKGPEVVYMVHKDDITAGDGVRRDVIEGKGELSCRTTGAVFRYLERRGIDTHYVYSVDSRTMVVY